MEIKERGLWYKFGVPIPSSPLEAEEDFLKRTKDCLVSFFEKYTKLTKEQMGYRHPLRNADLVSLKGEIEAWNFSEFELAGIEECDISFFVGTPQDNYGFVGIDVLANANKPEKKSMIDFLRRRWAEFDYVVARPNTF